MFYSRSQSICAFLVGFSLLWLSVWIYPMNTGRVNTTALAGTNKDDGAVEVVAWDEVMRQVENAREWIGNLASADVLDDRERDRDRRDPHDLLHHFGFTHAQSKLLANAARALQNVTQIYGKRVLSGLSHRAKRELCQAAGVDFITVDDCPSSTKYRTFDGACNNVISVNWGKAFSPFVRMLPPAYADDLANPRLSTTGDPLPSARDVSNNLIEDEVNNTSSPWTAIGMHIGQFLDHDVDHAALEKVNCTCNTTDKCLPIPVPANDPFFASQCLKFARSIPIPDVDCNPIPRQQVNQVTSFLDLSQVYGSSFEAAMEMRDTTKGKGQLRSLEDPNNAAGMQLLPNDEEHKDCVIASPQLKCGRAGDVRAAEQPGLVAIHTVLLRQHNRIANELSKLNPGWDDERLFNEARRVCIAMWQHVVYNEYLPPLLGAQNMALYGLRVNPNGLFYGYNPSVNPGVLNVFSAAAFRVGHTQVPSTLLTLDRDYQEIEHVLLSESFFNATHMDTSHGHGLDAFIRGMIVQTLPKVDLLITDHLTKHMFADPPGGQGLDLAALNIQRGRDHGIRPYNDWRVACKFPRASSFEDLKDRMKKDTVKKFRKAYDHVDDIDLFPALIGEETGHAQLVGPTLACLLGKQFRVLKFGDRFWYENGIGDQAFTKGQLSEIRKSTAARLFCDNLNELPKIHPYVFLKPSLGTAPPESINSLYKYSADNDFPDENGGMPGFFNGLVSCDNFDDIPRPSIEPWKE